jgi:hypothetical protein
MRPSAVVVSLGLALALVACRDPSKKNNSTVDARVDDMRIQDIQDDAMPPGTRVTVRGVVVTAIDTYGDRTGDFWVQEPEGGAFSGIKVHGAPLPQVAALAVGDVVDITGGEKDEFALMSDTSGRAVTEIKPISGGQLTVTKVGSGAMPEPTVVDALAIGVLDEAGRDAEWEKWEGVLIRVTNVTQLNAVRSFGSNPGPDSYEFRITGDARVQSALVGLPQGATRNDCYASITGVGDYFFNWLLLPRTADDYGGEGSDCPAAETLCTDGIDNDANGYTDCDDFNCQETEPSCVNRPTIAQIQMGDVTGSVILEDVYVTGLTFNRRHLWVASSLTAAPYEGIYVYRGSANNLQALPAEILEGAKVRIAGNVSEFGTGAIKLIQITQPTVTFVEAPTAAPTPVSDQTAAMLTNNKPYESVLVHLTNVEVTVRATMQTNFIGELKQAGTTFISLDRGTGTVGTCYATVTGIWTYHTTMDKWGIVPLATTAGGTCN